MTGPLLRLWVLIAVAVLLWLLWPRAEAQSAWYPDDCAAWAALVEQAEALPSPDWSGWLRTADPLARMYIMSARNWLAAGRTGAQAWRECESV